MLLRALIHRPVARGRLRIGLRTRVREGGCYLGIPRNGAFQGFRPSENTHSLQGPILDNAEHSSALHAWTERNHRRNVAGRTGFVSRQDGHVQPSACIRWYNEERPHQAMGLPVAARISGARSHSGGALQLDGIIASGSCFWIATVTLWSAFRV